MSLHKGQRNSGTFYKGMTAWNKGTTGLTIPWNKGKTKSTDLRVKRIALKLKGKKLTEEHKRLIGLKSIGRKPGNFAKVGLKVINSNGYINIKIKPHKWALEHRYLVEQYIGRKLKSLEIIHHIDGNPLNNKLSNLYITNIPINRALGILMRYKIIAKNFIKSNLKLFRKDE